MTYQAAYVEKRRRLSVFFRFLLVIPHLVLTYFVMFAAFFSATGAWLAVVITGRYPRALYDFNAGVTRWLTRVHAYCYLQVDAFPPIGFDDAPAYPVRVRFAEPLAKYSRAKAFFRFLLAIPVAIVVYALSLALFCCAGVVWLVAVVTGKLPRALHDALDFCLAYIAKAYAYFLLLTETYPPFSNADPVLETAARPGALPAAPVGFGPPTPAARERHSSGLEG